MMTSRNICLLALAVAPGCGEARSGADTSCTIAPGQVEGEAILSCPDGTSVVLNQADGSARGGEEERVDAVWHGNFVVTDDVDAVELQAYTEITGELWIRDLDAPVLYAPNLRRVATVGGDRSTVRSIVLPNLVDAISFSMATSPKLTAIHAPRLRKRLAGGLTFRNVPGISACDAAALGEELCADGSTDVVPVNYGGCQVEVQRCSTDPEDMACGDACTVTCGADGQDVWHCPGAEASEEGEGTATEAG